MKKSKNLLKEIWAERYGFLQLLAYFLAIGWYGYVLRVIFVSNLNLFVKLLLAIGGLIFGFFTCLSIHEGFKEEDQYKKNYF